MTTLKRFIAALVLVALSGSAALACGAGGGCCDCRGDKPAQTQERPNG